MVDNFGGAKLNWIYYASSARKRKKISQTSLISAIYTYENYQVHTWRRCWTLNDEQDSYLPGKLRADISLLALRARHTRNMKFAMIMEDCKYLLSRGISPVPLLSVIFALSLGQIPMEPHSYSWWNGDW